MDAKGFSFRSDKDVTLPIDSMQTPCFTSILDAITALATVTYGSLLILPRVRGISLQLAASDFIEIIRQVWGKNHGRDRQRQQIRHGNNHHRRA
mgnify:CR=1 FL=1